MYTLGLKGIDNHFKVKKNFYFHFSNKKVKSLKRIVSASLKPEAFFVCLFLSFFFLFLNNQTDDYLKMSNLLLSKFFT